MCLCGMLAAESGTLPEEMRDDMRHFFDENERWLVGVLKEGKRAKTLTFKGTPSDAARSLVGSLVAAGSDRNQVSTILGFVAVLSATVNVVGGFIITDRMLRMFRRQDPTTKDQS